MPYRRPQQELKHWSSSVKATLSLIELLMTRPAKKADITWQNKMAESLCSFQWQYCQCNQEEDELHHFLGQTAELWLHCWNELQSCWRITILLKEAGGHHLGYFHWQTVVLSLKLTILFAPWDHKERLSCWDKDSFTVSWTVFFYWELTE